MNRQHRTLTLLAMAVNCCDRRTDRVVAEFDGCKGRESGPAARRNEVVDGLSIGYIEGEKLRNRALGERGTRPRQKPTT